MKTFWLLFALLFCLPAAAQEKQIRFVNSITQLLTMTPGNPDALYIVGGTNAIYDGGSGIWFWFASDTQATNTCCVFATTTPAGRWKMLPFDLNMFGTNVTWTLTNIVINSSGGGSSYNFDPTQFTVSGVTNVSLTNGVITTNINEKVAFSYQGSVILLSTNYGTASAADATSLMLGFNAGAGNGGYRGNTAVGNGAGDNWVAGSTQFATAVGQNAGRFLSDFGSTAVGGGALALATIGQENVAIGQGAAAVITTGGENTIIGGQAAFGAPTSATINRAIIIGAYANGTGNNIADIGSDTVNYGVRLRVHGNNTNAFYVIGDGYFNNVLWNTSVPTFSSAGTNIVVDFANGQFDLSTTTNMFLIQSTNRPASSTNVLNTTLVIHADGANVIVRSSGLWRQTYNAALTANSLPLTITNGDQGIFTFRCNGPAETNVTVKVEYSH